MTIEEAKNVLVDNSSTFTHKYHAVIAIIYSDDATICDIVDCLGIEGVCAEMAAMRLHFLTSRKRPIDLSGVYLLKDEWADYLD